MTRWAGLALSTSTTLYVGDAAQRLFRIAIAHISAMLLRGLARLVPIAVILFIFISLALRFYSEQLNDLPSKSEQWAESALAVFSDGQRSDVPQTDLFPTHNDAGIEYTEIFSVSRFDRKYFPIKFGDKSAINPSIIPHPILKDTWIITAQHQRSEVKNTVWFAELACNAVFNNGQLECLKPPMNLPIAATFGDKCDGDLSYFGFNIGPHDARVFYGPKNPYTIYGSNSMFSCFGMWMLDFRMLVDWGFEIFAEEQFRKATEIQRPPPVGTIEKNWFVFWDKEGQMYAHYDVAPKRSFAKLQYDGSVGPDLAPLAATNDDQCIAKYMPKLAPQLESIHQATNSLLITLCKRADPSCEANDSNTFIFTIFQHKKYYSYHGVYEPYIMLFKQTAPFEVHGISKKALWIHGRGKEGEWQHPEGIELPDQTEMFYVTSMSWKTQGLKYHGYLDDELFIAFGIEDAKTGGIDFVAGDLIEDLGLCSSL